VDPESGLLIRFEPLPEPRVSVLIVSYGGWDVTRRTLEALQQNTDPEFEVVVVDNASLDGAADRLREEVEGATLLFNEANVGFGAATNQAAAAARGELLCLLNSDALVEPNWLPPLIETLEVPRVGAVVPMLLNADGSLQEAGSVIDSVGWAIAVGGGESPDRREYRFRREIDFGSAACLLMRRSDFLDVGGFDDAYAPAYFEDVDLSFKLKERGLRTMYEPRSRVVHLRFGSGNWDAARDLMVKNRRVFYRRWASRLLERPRLLEVASMPRRLVAARDAEALERFLVIDDRVPHRDRGSGDPRMFSLLIELADLWPDARITLAATDGNEADRYAEPLLAAGIEVVAPPVDWNLWFEHRRYHYSVAIVSRGQNWTWFDRSLRETQPQAFRIFDTEALTFRRLDLQRGIADSHGEQAHVASQANFVRQWEESALRDADAVFCVSPEEQDVVAQQAPGKPSFLLPGWTETAREPPAFDERADLLFFGGFLAGAGSPNEDALLYLVDQILQSFWQSQPEAILHVIGADVTPAVRALQSERVNIVGFVEDPREWFDRSRVHVSPLRFGAGVKQKLIDTMAAGLPFVTTTVGAEGLGLGELAPLLVADEPADLAGLIHKLYADADRWRRAQEGLLAIAGDRFGREQFRCTLVEGMSHVGVAPPPGAFATSAR
jgi:GT2 family glycosyltransferase